jgi:hypothetical protein
MRGTTPLLCPEYRALLQSPHVSFNSRILKSAMALGSQGTFPSREHGGLGMYDEGLAFLHLMGKAYIVTHLIATCYPGRCCLMELPGTVNPMPTSTLGLRGGEADMPRSADVVNPLPFARLSELHVGHSMTSISTSISVTVVDYPPFLYPLYFLHSLAPTALHPSM